MAHATRTLDRIDSPSWNSWLAVFLARPGRRARRPRLDPRELSGHLKRDMGFLDGNDPLGRRP